jgi:hypothetical protein
MKRNFCSLTVAVLLFSIKAKAQTITVDPVLTGAIITHAGVMNSGLDNTKSKLTLIEKGQAAVTSQLVIVNDMQNKIYKGLSEVSSVLTNLSTIKEIGDIGLDIFNDTEKALELAKSSPQLLLFAQENANDFKTRATSLALEVNNFALKGGANNLMDSGERSKFINHVATELRIMRGLAYGMERAMYWAKMKGFWKAVNPWQNYTDIDKRIATDVVSKSATLKRQ